MILNVSNFRIVTSKTGFHDPLRYRIQKRKWLLLWRNVSVDDLFTDYDTPEDAATAIFKHAADLVLTISFTQIAKVPPLVNPQDRFAGYKNEQGPWGGIFNG